LTLVDTNVLLDVITGDAEWVTWSVTQLDEARRRGPLVINDVIFAEIAVRYRSAAEVEHLFAQMQLVHAAIPREALFLAAKAFQRYRQAGGVRTGVLPDFFIGAQAAVAQLPLLTRDRQRYETYFPTVALITP
jgi:Predicted nucleic acid-binding protein, contains PIN domain